MPAQIDVEALRTRLGLTQTAFAARYHFNAARVRDWEQGRSRPDGAVRAYLLVIDGGGLAYRSEAQNRWIFPQASSSTGVAVA